jgi:hypothetical protein
VKDEKAVTDEREKAVRKRQPAKMELAKDEKAS